MTDMKTILLIEDNEMMRMFLVLFLGKDYQIYSVKNPEGAIEWLQEADVDLILSDFPSNAQLNFQIKALRASIDSKSIPLIMLTDQDKSEQRIQAFQWGAVDCLSKPFNPMELKMRIQVKLQMNSFSNRNVLN